MRYLLSYLNVLSILFDLLEERLVSKSIVYLAHRFTLFAPKSVFKGITEEDHSYSIRNKNNRFIVLRVQKKNISQAHH